MMLSAKCPNCNGTIKFDSEHVVTFCPFCGSHIDNMTDFVKQAIDLSLEEKRHNMQIETIEKDIKREQVKGTITNIPLIIKLIVGLPTIILFFILLLKLINLFS